MTGETNAKGVSSVRLQDDRRIYIRSTSEDKPEITAALMAKWQQLADLASKLLKRPEALITRVDPEKLNILVKNSNPDSVFAEGSAFPLGIGVYCETTMCGNDVNRVPDALSDEQWKDNPSVDFGMISYVGIPIKWPDGEVFGTICSLDARPHGIEPDDDEAMALFRSIIETDLELLLERQRLKSINASMLRESHHRIKNHLNIITSIMQLESLVELTSSDDFVKFYDEMESRIRAVAELHDLLAYSKGCCSTLDAYLGKVVSGLIKGVTETRVRLDMALDEVRVADETMRIYLGIIVNELITNSIRHAFTDTAQPIIELRLENRDGEFRLAYRDNGCGLPEGMDIRAADSLGMQLIHDLTTQMGGACRLGGDAGASFEFTFPNIDP